MVGGVFSQMRTIVRNNPKMTKAIAAGLTAGGAVHIGADAAKNTSSTTKKVVGGLAVTAAVVAGLAYGFKTGKFDKVANALKNANISNPILKKGAEFGTKALGKMNTAGEWILGKGEVLKEGAKKGLEAVKNSNVGKTVMEYAQKGFDAIKGLFAKA